MNNVLSVKNLTKNYGNFVAVDHISFSVAKGEIVGLLGPNGAGKTTTIQMLLDITIPDSGEIKYFGKEFHTHREEILGRINFASAFNTLQGRNSTWENLMVFAKLYNVKNPKKKILDLLEQFEISDSINMRYWDMSAGQKTRVNIIKSLLNDPEIILFDEPTASLDPDIAEKTISYIESLRKSGDISLLYTSHDMNEVTRLCDRVIFINHGKIVAEDSPLNLTKKIGTAKLVLRFDGDKNTVEEYIKKEKKEYEFLNNYTVSISSEEKDIPSLIFGVSKQEIWITDIEVKKPTLEDFFLSIARTNI